MAEPNFFAFADDEVMFAAEDLVLARALRPEERVRGKQDYRTELILREGRQLYLKIDYSDFLEAFTVWVRAKTGGKTDLTLYNDLAGRSDEHSGDSGDSGDSEVIDVLAGQGEGARDE